MATNRNVNAIGLALAASKIAKPTPTRTRGDSKQVLSKVFRSIEEVVDYCSSGEATIDKVADKLMWILHQYETPRDTEIHHIEQAGGNFEEQPGNVDLEQQPGGDGLVRVGGQEQAGGDNPERLQVEEQPDNVDPERLRFEEQPGGVEERQRDEDQRVRALTLDHLEQCRATSNYKIYSFLLGLYMHIRLLVLDFRFQTWKIPKSKLLLF